MQYTLGFSDTKYIHFYTSSAILQHLLPIQQQDSILALVLNTNEPRSKEFSPTGLPPPQTTATNGVPRISHLCPTQCPFRNSFPYFGSHKLLGWFSELWECFAYSYLFTVKGYNSGIARWEIYGIKYWSPWRRGAWNFHMLAVCLPFQCLSAHTNSKISEYCTSEVFIRVLLCGHGSLNHCPLVIVLYLCPLSPFLRAVSCNLKSHGWFSWWQMPSWSSLPCPLSLAYKAYFQRFMELYQGWGTKNSLLIQSRCQLDWLKW